MYVAPEVSSQEEITIASWDKRKERKIKRKTKRKDNVKATEGREMLTESKGSNWKTGTKENSTKRDKRNNFWITRGKRKRSRCNCEKKRRNIKTEQSPEKKQLS